MPYLGQAWPLAIGFFLGPHKGRKSDSLGFSTHAALAPVHYHLWRTGT